MKNIKREGTKVQNYIKSQQTEFEEQKKALRPETKPDRFNSKKPKVKLDVGEIRRLRGINRMLKSLGVPSISYFKETPVAEEPVVNELLVKVF